MGVQHLAALAAVEEVVTSRDGISHPIVDGGLAHHRPHAAVPDAPDHLVDRIAVGRVGMEKTKLTAPTEVFGRTIEGAQEVKSEIPVRT